MQFGECTKLAEDITNMTSEELYNYVHGLLTKIRARYKDIDVCEFDEDKMCINRTSTRIEGYGCCFGCKYHSIVNGCQIKNVNLTCMAVYCESVKLLLKEDKKRLKSIETLLKMLGVQPRLNYEEQIMVLDNYNNCMNTSEYPLRDVYNLFNLFDFEN